jgi:2-octaprenyl-6-methoxyphenol hydroxylase
MNTVLRADAAPHAAAATPQHDLVIVGGGMVGACLALALAPGGRSIVLVEPVLPESNAQPSFDERTTALSNGTRRILETLGVWPQIEAQAAPIRSIHVSDAGRFGVTRLEAAEQGLAALGYTMPNRVLGAALWDRLRAEARITLHAPARVTAVKVEAGQAELQLTAEGAPAAQRLRARLVVAADGANSLVRRTAGIPASVVDYHQVAIVANLRAAIPASGIAYERFTPHGPLALLPLPDGSYTLVWTVLQEVAPALLATDDAALLTTLQERLGWRVGALQQLGKRSSYPLALTRTARSIAPRTVLVGNAAQTLHPVAGQGFNLGIRDAALLADLMAAAGDPGDPVRLERFERQRASDRRNMIGFTDGLVRLFGSERPGVPMLRSLGLLLFDLSPPAKTALSRISWGFGHRATRLLRGLPPG